MISREDIHLGDVKEIEFFPDGSIKRVVFRDPAPLTQPYQPAPWVQTVTNPPVQEPNPKVTWHPQHFVSD